MKIFIFFISFYFLSTAKDNLNLKKWKSHAAIVENGQTVFTANSNNQKNLSANENHQGFSFQQQSGEIGVCHLRLKIVCDYGLEFQKALKNTDISL